MALPQREINLNDCKQNPPTFSGVMELSLAKSDPTVTPQGAMMQRPSLYRKEGGVGGREKGATSDDNSHLQWNEGK